MTKDAQGGIEDVIIEDAEFEDALKTMVLTAEANAQRNRSRKLIKEKVNKLRTEDEVPIGSRVRVGTTHFELVMREGNGADIGAWRAPGASDIQIG